LLVLVAVVVSRWQRMGVERPILWAALRAAAQLLAVGFLLRLIFESSGAWLWSSFWVVGMVVVAAETVSRRAPLISGIRTIALLAIGSAGATNAAILAAQIIGLHDEKVLQSVRELKVKQTRGVEAKNQALQERLGDGG